MARYVMEGEGRKPDLKINQRQPDKQGLALQARRGLVRQIQQSTQLLDWLQFSCLRSKYRLEDQ